MEKLINELKGNEKIMKRVAKDKENGLREATLAIIQNAVVNSEWFKENYDTDGFYGEELYQRIVKQDEVINQDFMKKVFEELAK